MNRIVAIFALMVSTLVAIAPMAEAATNPSSTSFSSVTSTATTNGSATINLTVGTWSSSPGNQLTQLRVCYQATTTFSGSCPGTPVNFSSTSLSSSGSTSATLTGLTPGTVYYFLVAATTTNASTTWIYSSTQSFTETRTATVATSVASSITTVQANLNGTVNPNGDSGVGTSLMFCYSTSSSISTCSGATQLAVEGTQTGSSSVSVTAIATYLAPGTTYYYILQATSSLGNVTVSSPSTSFTTLGPVLTNASGNVTNIMASTATVSPTFNSGGSGASFSNTSIRVCYSTSSPVNSGNCPNSVVFGAGTYSDGVDHTSATNLTGLNSGTTYYYALVSSMTYYTNATTTATANFASATQSFTTTDISLTLNSPTSITNATATFNGSINANGNPVTNIKYCYSTQSLSNCSNGGNVTTVNASKTTIAANDSTVYDLTTNVTGLGFNATYYLQLCATVTSTTCTAAIQFTTLGPTLATTDATAVGPGTATLNGTINPNGYSTTVQFCYSTNSSMTSCNSATTVSINGGAAYTNSSSNSLSATVTGLASGTTYYYILMATEGSKNGYSKTTPISSFTTPGPYINTSSATSITQTSATANGTVNTFNTSTAVSICYSTVTLVNCVGGTVLTIQITPNPYSNNSNASISAALSSLGAGKTYYYQIMAVQGATTYYSNVTSFNTLPPGPIVTNTGSSTPQSTSVTVNGTINPGGYSSTAWVCLYVSSSKPSSPGTSCSGGTLVPISGTYTGTTVQTITATITGLTANTTYNYYFVGSNVQGTNLSQAINSIGPPVTWKSYNMPSFTTAAVAPVVQATQVTNIAAASAKLWGTVQPYSQATTVSFCYSTSSTISSCSGATQVTLSGTVNGASVATVSTLISGLTPNTTYYYIVQGSATGGTPVSAALSFTTLAAPNVVTTSATGFTNNSAVLRGTVSSNGSSSSTVFCYSTSSSLSNCSGGTVSFVAVAGSPFAGSTVNQTITATLSNLSAGTTYYYQIRGTNGAGTAYSNVSNFHTIGGPFGSITNFYQVSATSPALYVYSALTNTQTTLGSNTQSGINALGFDSIDGYIYGLDAKSVLWKIDNTGTYTSLGTVTGLPANTNTGGDFIPGTNYFLVNNGTIGWYVIDVSQPTLTATAFTVTTQGGSQPWTAADVVLMQNGSTYYGYGVNGSYLNILTFVGSGATSGTETSRTVTSGTSGKTFPTGVYGATFCDSNGNVYVFSNSTSQLWEIPRSQIQSNGSSVVAYLVVTASPALASPNDGASSPYVISPFDPPQPVDDTYSVLLNNTLTVNSVSASVLSNDQGGLPFAVNSFTFNGSTVSVANQGVSYSGVGVLTFTDFTNGYFTFVPASGFTGDATFTYDLIETSSPNSSLRTSLGTATVTIHVVRAQTVSWTPTTTLTVAQSPYQPSVATTNGNGTITYATSSPNTSGCAVDPNTGVLTYAATGSCTVIATASATSTYAAASATVTFTVTTAPQTITWNPTQSLLSSQSPYTPSVGAITSGDGAISYAVQAGFTTSTCTVNATTGVLTFTGTGTCTVVVTAAATSLYSVATQSYVFTISSYSQTITWAPSTSLVATAGSNTFAAATSSSTGTPGAITYSIVDPGTTGCTIANASSPTLTFTGAGNCQVMATAAATSSATQATASQIFVISLVTQVVTWSPTTALTMASTSNSPTAATDLGSVPITYSVSNAGSTGCSVNASTGALTWTNAGSCVVIASAAATSQYTAASATVTFVISLLAQTVTWSPTNTYNVLQSPQTLSAATALGGVVPTYAVTTAGAGCSINPSTRVLIFNAAGTCVVTASAAATSVYASAATAVTFTISLATQTVTWTPTTALYYTQSPWTYNIGAVTTGDGAITYSKTSNTSGACSVTSTAITFTNSTNAATNCVVTATAAATATYAAASVSVTFTFDSVTPVITWSTQSSLVLPLTSYTLPAPTPSSASSGAYTYSVASKASNVNCTITTAGVITASFSSGTTGTCSVTATQAAVNGFYYGATLTKVFNLTAVALTAQTVTWTSTSTAATTSSPYTLSAASALGGATISYAVSAFTTATCSVSLSGSTPVVTYTGAGTCTIVATAAATSTYASGTATNVFTSTLAPQTITWNPTLAIDPSQSPLTVAAATALGAPTLTYSVSSFTTTSCSISSSTHILTFRGSGTCTVTVAANDTSADPNGQYANATLSKTFTSTLLSQTVTWSPQLTLNMPSGTYTPPLATALGGVVPTYSTSSSVCTVNSTTGVVSYTGAGNCVVVATATSNGIYATATNTQTIVISLLTPTITWVPVSTVTDTSQSPYTPDTLATTTSAGAITYAVTSQGTTGCSVNSTTGVITYTGQGSCVVTATAAATTTYAQVSTSVTFTINPVTPMVIWTPSSTAATASAGTFSPTLASTTGNGAITYSVLTNTNTSCSVDPNTGVLTFTGGGTCTVMATSAATSIYASAFAIVTFTIADAPTVTTFGAYSITRTSATVSGSVNSNSATATVVICWTTGSDLANCTSTSSVTQSTPTPSSILGSDLNDEIVTYGLTGLTGGVTYYYQVCATNSIGTNCGSVLSFQTVGAPTVTVSAASSVSGHAATVGGTVNANSATTTVTICYSTAASMASCASGLATVTSRNTTPGTLSGTTTTPVTLNLTGLNPNTTYYYQVKAVNSSGTVYSSVLSFTTPQATQIIYSPLIIQVPWTSTNSVATTADSGLTVSYSTSTPGCSVDASGTVTATGAITCSVVISQSGNSNYVAATSVTIPVTFLPANQATVNVTSTSQLYPSTLTLTSNGGSGTGSTTYTVVSTGSANCSISGGVLSATGPGTCTVTATKASDPNYNSQTSSVTTITFAAALTVTTSNPTGTTASATSLRGAVNANSDPSTTTIQFCYQTTSFTTGNCSGTTVTASPSSASGSSSTAESYSLSGLSAGTTYYYEISATNALGTVYYGGVKSLTTLAADGSGTVTANKTSVSSGAQGQTITFTYTTATGGMSGGAIQFVVPTGWSVPSNSNSAAGYVTVSGSSTTPTVSVSGRTVTITNVTSQTTVTIVYGDTSGTGTGATAYSVVGSQTWQFLESGSGATPVNLASSPSIAIVALTLAFNPGLGSGSMTSMNYVSNVAQNLTANSFTRTGYTFAGWDTSSAASTVVYSNSQSVAITVNTTLYAVWTPNTYVTTYNAGTGGSVSPSTASFTVGGASLTLPTPTKQGYSFNGWYTLSSGGSLVGTGGGSYSPTTSSTLYAQWTANTENVTFHKLGGTSTTTTQTFTSDVSQNLTSNIFTRAGYSFSGWDTSSSGSTVVYHDGDSLSITAALDLYAVWTPNATIYVTYDPAGGSSVAGGSGLAGTSLNLANAPTRTGYNFAGWSDGTTTYVAGYSYLLASSVTMTAQWTAQVYVVTYNPGSGSVSPTSASYTYAGSALVLPTPSYTGYTFNGWYTASSGGSLVGAGGANYTPSQSTTLYAQWTANTNHIAYNPNGGSVSPTTQNYVSGASAITLPTPNYVGYTFTGWYNGSSFVGNAGDPFTTLADVTLTAAWSANTYTVTYNPGTGASVSPTSASFTSGTTPLVLPLPTKAGYTFSGWYSASTGGTTIGNAGSNYSPTVSSTLYGRWTINSYTVTYNAGAATTGSAPVDSASPYTYGSTVTVLNQGTLDRMGYDFAGWNTQSDGNGTTYYPGDSFMLGAGNVTLYPVWAAHADGLGTVSVSPSTVVSTSAGNTLAFTFTAGLSSYNGSVTFTVPTGFSAPSTTNRVGLVMTTAGSVSVSGRVITVSGLSLYAGQSFVLYYGATNNGGLGSVAPTDIGPTVWTVQQQSLTSGTLTAIAQSPVVTVVNSADGSGTADIVPDHVIANTTGNVITLTYTSTIGGMNNGVVTFTIPDGWSAPSTNSSDPGYCTVSGSTTSTSISVNGQVVTVSGVTLGTFQTLTLIYGAGGGATASGTIGTAYFPVSEQSTAGGNLIQLITVPSLMVMASNDGTGYLSASPTSVLQNSSGNTITLTYTAAAAMTNGSLSFAIPAGWSTPSTTGVTAGYITSSTGTLSVSGRVVTITGITIANGGTVTISFGNRTAAGPGATSPVLTGSTIWNMSQAATNTGVLTQLQTAPIVYTTAGKPVFTSTYAPSFTQGIGGSQNVTAVGGGNLPPTITASYQGGIILPIGVTFTAGTNTGAGVITISPTTALGTYSVLFTASNTGGTNTQLFIFQVVSSGQPTAIYATTDYLPSTVDLSWLAPEGITVDHYDITSYDWTAKTAGPSQVNLTTTSTVFSSLIGGDTYQFTVTAYFNGTDSAYALSNLVLPVTYSPIAPVTQGPASYSQLGTSQASQGTPGQVNSISAVATGQGSVSVGSYTNTNPTLQSGFSIPNGSTSYDVRVSPGSAFSTVSFVICGVVGNKIYWFDSISKVQRLVNPAPIPVAGQPGCSTVNLSNTSTPAINDGTLYGSIFYTPAADGTGTMVITPATAVSASTGNSVTLTYTAANDLANGAISVNVPQGWPAPSLTPGQPGYVTSSKGTLSVSGMVITVSNLSIASHSNVVIVYASRANSSPGVTTPISAQTWIWNTQERSSQYGTLLALASAPSNRTTGTTLAATGVTALVTNNTITVSWTAPVIPSGSPLLVVNYLVTASPSGATCTVNVGVNVCVFPNVLNNVIYTFTIKVNGNGPSATSSSVTPRALGGAKTVVLDAFNGNDTALPSSYAAAVMAIAQSIVANHYTNVKIVGSSFNALNASMDNTLGTNRARNIKNLLLADLTSLGAASQVVMTFETFGPTIAAASNATSAGQVLNQRNIVLLS